MSDLKGIVVEVIESLLEYDLQYLIQQGSFFEKLLTHELSIEGFEVVKRELRSEYSGSGYYIFKWRDKAYKIQFSASSDRGIDIDLWSFEEVRITHKTIEVYE